MSDAVFLRRQRLLGDLSRSIKEQDDVRLAIRAACERRRATGREEESSRFSRLRDRERQLPSEIQRLQAEIAACGKPMRDSVRHEFMSVAKERLPAEVFAEWRSEAQRRAGVAMTGAPPPPRSRTFDSDGSDL